MSNQKTIRVRDFVNSALKEFSLYDNVRSIPILFDGLKPSQRKALYGSQLKGENADEIQVERLAAWIAERTDYHHGTGSMEGTVIGMANNYAGSNNLNLFVPSGQFGSRLTKESAAPRYIFTQLSPNFRSIFKKDDDAILISNLSDGDKIEPKYYIPLLPMMLVNGTSGTGTGHANLILSYNPNDIRDAILKVLDGKKLKKNSLVPWYNGFKGKIEKDAVTGQVTITGSMKIVNSTTISITELPIGFYHDPYKEHLFKLEDAGLIKESDSRSTEEGFDFTLTVPRTTTALGGDVLMQKLKLISRDTENFTLWNEKGTLEKFESAEAIIERFVPWRLDRYEDRRQKMIVDTQEKIRWLSERLRFILFYLDNVDEFKNKKKETLIELLLKNNFVDYERLLQMQIWSLTKDKIDELKKQLDDDAKYLKTLQSDTAEEMYRRELKEFKYSQ